MAGSRYIPVALKNHLAGSMLTVARLLKIKPSDASGLDPYGVTDLDQDIVYDDGSGDGPITYLAPIGYQPADIMQSGDIAAIDNSEAAGLLPEYDVPISEAQIRAGALDGATFALYLVNFESLADGHTQIHGGPLGQVRIRDDGLSYVPELLGLSKGLQVNVCSKDSLSCRATFGSQQQGSATPGPQVQRDWCGYAAEAELAAGEVDTVGLESTRTFTVTDASGWTDDMLVPGLWVWETGDNAGRSQEIESNTAGGEVTLAVETDYPIAAGDTGRYRADCSKQARDEAKGCKRWWGADWVYHFRGEPDIPVGDAEAIAVPGASSGPGQGGRSFQPLSSDA